jgi:D-arginine dehydrogenase
LNPDALAFAAWSDAPQDIDTDLVLQTYARRIRERGGEIRTRALVTALARTETGWRARAGDNEIEAVRVVNAAGAWADTLAAMAGLPTLGLQPRRRSIAQIPVPGGHDAAGWPMVLNAGETWYMKPQGGKLLVSPADADPVEPHDAWADDMVLAEGLARYEAMVTEPVTRVETSWAGLRTVSPDGALVLGPDPLEPGFVWCAGQGGQGFISAPGAAMVLGEMIGCGASGLGADTLAALAPARFR